MPNTGNWELTCVLLNDFSNFGQANLHARILMTAFEMKASSDRLLFFSGARLETA
jgi:hypothetical protein